MEVILLQKIGKLGDLGDKVSVRPGYARNYLIPQGKASVATPARLAEFEQRRAELEAKAVESLASAQGLAERIGAMDLSLAQKAGDEGKLFGSVGAKDIADAVSRAGVVVDKQAVRLPDGHAIRHLGDYEVEIHLHADVNATLKLKVVAE